MAYKTELVASPKIEQAILLVCGQRVIRDRDLAAMYGVTTCDLNKAVQRNRSRFPADFMCQLTADEAEALRFQIGILKKGLHFRYDAAFSRRPAFGDLGRAAILIPAPGATSRRRNFRASKTWPRPRCPRLQANGVAARPGPPALRTSRAPGQSFRLKLHFENTF